MTRVVTTADSVPGCLRALTLMALTAAALAWASPALAANALTSPGGAVERAAAYLAARQQEDGGFAEPGGRSDPGLTAWAVLALRAAGRDPEAIQREGVSPADYLAGAPYPAATDLELRILALVALGRDVTGLATRLEALRRPSGAIGPSVNSTIWGILALRAARRPVAAATVRYLLGQQRASGGWSWHPSVAPDSNDTAAAIQALRAAGVPARASSVSRGLVYLRRLQNADGGFELEPDRGSDAQSTGLAIQAFLAAGRDPGRLAYSYLARLRRADGSFRYSRSYSITPVWVTAQVVPALAGRPYPLR